MPNNNQYYVFGLQRSGTNFLETILNQNFMTTRMNGNAVNRCWKHSIDVPVKYNKDVTTFIIHKNPYTWVESIALRNTVDWLKTQTTYPALEINDPRVVIGTKKKLDLINLCKTYRHFHETWLDKGHMVIKYEDMLIPQNRTQIINNIHTDMGLTKKTGIKPPQWIIPNKGQVSQSRDYTQDREQYYIKGKPKTLSDLQIATLNEVIGTDLILKMGYEVLQTRY